MVSHDALIGNYMKFRICRLPVAFTPSCIMLHSSILALQTMKPGDWHLLLNHPTISWSQSVAGIAAKTPMPCAKPLLGSLRVVTHVSEMLEAFANGYADVLTGIQQNDLILVDNWRTDKSQESLGVVHRLYIVASHGFYVFKINVFLQERFISLHFHPPKSCGSNVPSSHMAMNLLSTTARTSTALGKLLTSCKSWIKLRYLLKKGKWSEPLISNMRNLGTSWWVFIHNFYLIEGIVAC